MSGDDAVFKALADPTRRFLLDRLFERDGRTLREKHHFLNPIPIRLIHDRWISKYAEAQVSALTDLKSARSVAGPGWMRVLSGLKTVLETGQPLA